MTNKRGRLLGIVVSIQLLVLLSWVPTAGAHAAYESSDPANGATVSSPPDRVTADFTEPVVDGSRLEVYDPCGLRVDGGDSFVAFDRVTVSMSGDKQGTYTVAFHVVSSVDGHPTDGQFSFASSGGGLCPEPASGEDEGGGDGEDQSGNAEITPAADDATEGSDGSGSARGNDRAGGKDDGPTGKEPKRRQDKERAPVNRRHRSSRRPAAADIPGDSLVEQGAGAPGDIPQPALFLSILLAAAIGAVSGKVYLKT